MKKAILLAIVVCFFVCACDKPVDEPKTHDFVLRPDGFKELTEGVFTFQWRIVAENIEVKILAPTTGWVAVGFDPVWNMFEANIIIGYVNFAGATIIEDHFGTDSTDHIPDNTAGGRDNLLSRSGMETDSTTLLWFAIPLDSGDSLFDKVLLPGEIYTLVFAHGANGADETASRHIATACVIIKL